MARPRKLHRINAYQWFRGLKYAMAQAPGRWLRPNLGG